MLRKARWLDPRRLPAPPIVDAVNIPVEELLNRVHELPAKEETIRIANTGGEAIEVQRWLRSHGRVAELGEDFTFGESGHVRLWSPNPVLERCVPSLPIGTALDLACGSGRDAVFLASCGFEVAAVDHLLDAIILGNDLARRYLERDAKIEWLHHDLERPLPLGGYDLVTCFFYLNRQILAEAAKLLAPGGSLIVETFTTGHRARFGKPRSEQFVLQPGELRELAHGLHIVEYDEDWHDGKHTAQLWAKL